MSKSRNEVVQESKVKGLQAGAATVATVALGVAVGPAAAVVAAVPAAVLGWRWWKHRAENGIRF
jgi:hypothetical protein